MLCYSQNSDWLIDLSLRPLYALFPTCADGGGLQWAGFDMMLGQETRTESTVEIGGLFPKKSAERSKLSEYWTDIEKHVKYLET